MQKKRRDHEPPFAVASLGWRYHHLGIPTMILRPGEHYLPHLKIHVSGFETSAFGIEWMRFEPDCEISELVRTVPHVAFEVDDLEAALAALGVTSEITSPSEGVRVAMIVDDGAPVELIEFRKKSRRPQEAIFPAGDSLSLRLCSGYASCSPAPRGTSSHGSPPLCGSPPPATGIREATSLAATRENPH
jgi:hypothetical protein